jgi:hypothetical protein
MRLKAGSKQRDPIKSDNAQLQPILARILKLSGSPT